MQLSSDGAERHRLVLSETQCVALEALLAPLPSERAGTRIHGLPGLSDILGSQGAIGRFAATYLSAAARPVRALLFNKSAAANWSLAWHQDRTIAVAERVDTHGFGPWTVKAGLTHVAPPFALLERMITLRVHLDPVGPDNAPLLIVPGSHRLGRIAEPDITALVERHGTATCVAQRGDIWAYATPILHASEAAVKPSARRVLQIDYSGDDLPGTLEWLGI